MSIPEINYESGKEDRGSVRPAPFVVPRQLRHADAGTGHPLLISVAALSQLIQEGGGIRQFLRRGAASLPGQPQSRLQ